VISAPDRVAITVHVPAVLNYVNSPEYPLQRRLGGLRVGMYTVQNIKYSLLVAEVWKY
jgi:hypothetical protein